jgi:hypothetical protein
MPYSQGLIFRPALNWSAFDQPLERRLEQVFGPRRIAAKTDQISIERPLETSDQLDERVLIVFGSERFEQLFVGRFRSVGYEFDGAHDDAFRRKNGVI